MGMSVGLSSIRVEVTYIHPSNEFSGLHALEIPIHTLPQSLLIPWYRLVDLTHRLSHMCGTQKPVRKTGNAPSEAKFAVALIRAHEEKVIFDIHA
jgi:hypothetical protein